MAQGSNVNPNFPIPGLDQSSKGFRDNFATIKKEIETIQGTTIQLTGGVESAPYALGDSENIVITTAINSSIISLPPPNYAIQYNDSGILTGDPVLIWDPTLKALGVGVSTLTGDHTVDIAGNIAWRRNAVVTQDTAGSSANIVLQTVNQTVIVDNTDNTAVFGSQTYAPVAIVADNTPQIWVEPGGNVGIGTTTLFATLEVMGTKQDIARYHAAPGAADNIFRISTIDVSSTIGIGLEHRGNNWLGGMRMDENGTVSIHVGENMDAYLSTSSSRFNVDNSGKVGIGVYNPTFTLHVDGNFKSTGITDNSDPAYIIVGINNVDPNYTLDVVGDIAHSGAMIADVTEYTVGAVPVVIDTWSIDEFRTARYTIQVYNLVGGLDQVDIWEGIVTHANEMGYVHTLDLVTLPNPANPALGSFSVVVQPDRHIELMFTGTANGNRVKINKAYITI